MSSAQIFIMLLPGNRCTNVPRLIGQITSKPRQIRPTPVSSYFWFAEILTSPDCTQRLPVTRYWTCPASAEWMSTPWICYDRPRPGRLMNCCSSSLRNATDLPRLTNSSQKWNIVKIIQLWKVRIHGRSIHPDKAWLVGVRSTIYVCMCVFGFQKEVGPDSAGVSTTPGFPLHKDHACTGHILPTRVIRHKLLARFLWPISSPIGSLLTVLNPSHVSIEISRTSSSILVSYRVSQSVPPRHIWRILLPPLV